jgi:hypothetical protein
VPELSDHSQIVPAAAAEVKVPDSVEQQMNIDQWGFIPSWEDFKQIDGNERNSEEQQLQDVLRKSF